MDSEVSECIYLSRRWHRQKIPEPLPVIYRSVNPTLNDLLVGAAQAHWMQLPSTPGLLPFATFNYKYRNITKKRRKKSNNGNIVDKKVVGKEPFSFP